MSDERHACPSSLVPGVIGGLVGAALVDASHRENAARLRQEIDRLADIERERLAQEKKRLTLAETDAQRNEAERTYRQAVLWLEHCNNDERLEWLVRGHGAALANELAKPVIAKARERREVVALFDDVTAARHALEAVETNKRGREAQRDELRRRRWSGAGIGLACAVVGLAILIPFWIYFGANAVGGYVMFLMVCAIISPLIIRWQPTPKDLASRIPGSPFTGSWRESMARIESAIATAETEISSATIELALAREAVVQAFRSMRPALLEEAKRHLPSVRTRIETLQAIYPPRIRCDLAAVSDDKLHAHFAPHFPAAIDRGVTGMM